MCGGKYNIHGPLKKTAKKKAKLKKGDKVRLQYPDAIYEGVVSSSIEIIKKA